MMGKVVHHNFGPRTGYYYFKLESIDKSLHLKNDFEPSSVSV